MVKAERSESSSSSTARQAAPAPAKQPSPLTIATLQIMKARPHLTSHKKKPGSSILHFDQSERRYGWLLPGWIAEERRMATGRLYKYYYDPAGRQFRTLREVLYAWEQSGMIVIDL